jgi:NlpC/P60 family putative phage cell wall peptidase
MTAEASRAEAERGEEIVALARGWIGTPYEHQSSCRGAGTDCLGLLRGLWREMLGSEPEAAPAYTPDWSEPSRSEDLLAAARRHLIEVARVEAQPGDVALLRMRDDGVAKHVGVLARSAEGHETLIHAYSGHGVVESPLTPAWSRRIAAVFRFPRRTA